MLSIYWPPLCFGLQFNLIVMYPFCMKASESRDVMLVCVQVIQRREDGSVNFFRGWEAYRDGFGTTTGEHWLGLQQPHSASFVFVCQLLLCSYREGCIGTMTPLPICTLLELAQKRAALLAKLGANSRCFLICSAVVVDRLCPYEDKSLLKYLQIFLCRLFDSNKSLTK